MGVNAIMQILELVLARAEWAGDDLVLHEHSSCITSLNHIIAVYHVKGMNCVFGSNVSLSQLWSEHMFEDTSISASRTEMYFGLYSIFHYCVTYRHGAVTPNLAQNSPNRSKIAQIGPK